MTTTELQTKANQLIDAPPVNGYHVALAADAADVLAAQRLRYDVFATEGGADTPGPAGLDVDPFDDLCDHLLVRASGPSADPGEVVATYRLLPPHANDSSPRGHGLYSHTEFDLTALEGILDRTVEAGRSCVAAEHRTAAPISLLWGGIARYMQLTGYRYLMGCASIPLTDGGSAAASFADLAAERYAAPPALRCRPRREFEVAGIARRRTDAVPPLLRGYLRLGAVVCGPPAFDPDFGTADFLVLLDLQTANRRYLRFFLGADDVNLLRDAR
ncbi:Putative hemolysin [Nakamurella panacisegetis]|uniref:Putative hemolysin n=1 Tax=Nakamurella panacisegetis TaxID=1090615 RepID=A0A1H0I307_9ACTN|nr:GNAT family N-acyltransferase [Nakamurella panacisegetis]SDO25792.1 Putative hemolysin [Nakamurella panacisegetis]